MLTRKETLETLKKAASVRKHEALKKLTEGESDEVPSLLYHRKCYQYFTLKRSLEKIENNNKRKSEILNTKLQETDNFDSQEDDIRPKRGEFGNTVNNTVLLAKKCLFCKKDKYVKRIKEKLAVCLEFRTVRSIKTAATKINDFQILGLTTDDLIAKEAHYIIQVFTNFTHTSTKIKQIPLQQLKTRKRFVNHLSLSHSKRL